MSDLKELGAGDPSLNGRAPKSDRGFWGKGLDSAKNTFREARNWSELRKSPYGMTPLLVLAWGGLLVQFSGQIAGLSFKQVGNDIDILYEEYVRYTSFVGFIGLFAVIGMAYIADRRKRLPLVIVGLMIAGVFTGLQGAATSKVAFQAPGVIAGFMFLFATTPLSALFADFYPPEVRGKVFALYGLFGVFGSVVFPYLAGLLIESVGWRPMYLVAAAGIFAFGVIILLRLREPIRGYFERKAMGADEDVALSEEEPVSFGEAWRTVFGIRTLRRLMFASAFGGIGFQIYSRARLAMLFDDYGFDESDLGLIFTLSALLFTVPATYLAGGIVDSLLKKRPSQVLVVYGGMLALSGVGTLLYAFKPPFALLFFFGGLVSFGSALIGPALGVLFVSIVPANVRVLGGAVQNLSDIPGFLIVPVALSLRTDYGNSLPILVGVPFYFIAVAIFISAAPLFELDMRSAFAANIASEEWRAAKRSGKGKLLVCRDIDVHYGQVQVLFGVDFDVEENEIIALLGTNGAGKSTLLKAIAGTTVASSGAVVFDGRDTTYMPPHEIAARGVIFMPGGRGTFPGLTVRENLLLGSWMTDDPAEVRQSLADVFEMFPILKERAGEPAVNLSGGEQQMLSLAQAFLCKPRLLMIDELSLGLSPAVVGQLIEIVRAIHARGTTIIVVEQSVNVALALAEKAIFMEKGEVKFFGLTKDLRARPDILRAVYVKGTGGALTEGAPAGAQANRRAYELEQARPVLELEGLVKRFGGITAVDHVGFDLRDGEVLGVIGPNGSGKTTLFELISGFQVPDEGSVRYEGVDITTLGPEERARRKLVRRFQDARLFPSLSVYETLLLALDQRLEVKSSLMAGAGLPGARRAEKRVRLRADRLVELLELGSYRDKFVKELSTGLRRIVDLACVLATEPKVLLLDEPSSGIAQAEAEGLAPLLKRVRYETGCSILIIEHDMPLISAVSDELIALERGAFVLRGLPDVVLNDERVIQAYLGSTEETIKRSGSVA